MHAIFALRPQAENYFTLCSVAAQCGEAYRRKKNEEIFHFLKTFNTQAQVI